MTTRRLTRQHILANALSNHDENNPSKHLMHSSENAIIPGKKTISTSTSNKKRHALDDVSNFHSKEANAPLASKSTNVRHTNAVYPIHRPQERQDTIKAVDDEPVSKKRRQPSALNSLSSFSAAHPVDMATTKPVTELHAETYAKENEALSKKLKKDTEERIPLQEIMRQNAAAEKTEVQDWDDLDAEDWADPLMVSEYVVDIFQYLNQLEIETMPSPTYMDRQRELAWKMRGILTDWIIEVHSRFRLLPETLFLAVNIIDRFLSLRVCSLGKLQLVGIAALFIASKYEEVMCPSVQNFVYMADGSYDEEDILQAERYILRVLEFNLAFPNPMNFLRRISKADYYDIQTRTVAKYLVEIALLDHRLLPYPPSQQCAAAMYLAREMLGRGVWNRNLVHYSGYEEHELISVVKKMINYLQKPVRHEAFFKKYASKKFMKASLFVRDWIKKNSMPLEDDIDEDYAYHQEQRIHHDMRDESW
ncbi:G2/M B-type cyclin Cdc13 [Schizosaccharomyces octosporus yFS286]|uniref:G2/M B-type cyclin Cdc13 n=1 Tax=Schizosaccharomyces octosporus (strain yFS286) TaxID=483514 RepID=S9PWI4_SCHOY|nr:G2/M B-type cyclin Cdc13 [Schizosaccharomyces octosporus yFS286]EPX73446.1 G2/M B-type cyclin Cdc13 [Schizosaccharomyces octosporus yFS286]